jgi:hypothetical protein
MPNSVVVVISSITEFTVNVVFSVYLQENMLDIPAVTM